MTLLKTRSFRIVLEVAAGLLAGLVFLIAIAAWRLSEGPVQLTFLAPAIERALQDADSPFEIQVGDTVLTWAGWERAVDILALDVRVGPPGQRPVAVLPEVSFGLSIDALMRGVIAPTNLEIFRPDVAVRRYEDGRFAFGLAGRGHAAELLEQEPVSMHALELLLQPGAEESLLAALRRVSIVDATLTIDDRFAGVTWTFPQTNIALVRDDAVLRGNASALLQAGAESMWVSAVLQHDLGSDEITLSIGFDGLSPGLVARALPELEFLEGVEAAVSGSASLAVDTAGKPRRVSAAVNSGIGRVRGSMHFAAADRSVRAELQLDGVDTAGLAAAAPQLAELSAFRTWLSGSVEVDIADDGGLERLDVNLTGPEGAFDATDIGAPVLEFRDLSIAATATDDFDAVTVHGLTFSILEGSPVALAAAAVRDGDLVRFGVNGRLRDVAFRDTFPFWPRAQVRGALDWLEPNFTAGHVPEATVEMQGTALLGDPASFSIDRLQGQASVEDAEVHYLRPMPPIQGIAGQAEFGLDTVTIRTQGGRVGDDIRIGEGLVHFYNLGNGDNARIEFQVESPLRDALELLDREPYRLISPLGIDPADIAGAATADVGFEFRMIKALLAEDIAYRATGRLEGVTMRNAPLGTALSGGTLDLWLAPDGMDIAGAAQMNGVPALVTWRENFGDEDLRSRYEFSATVSDRHLREIGVNPGDVMSGFATINLEYLAYRDEGALSLSADLTKSRLSIGALDVSKPYGEAASLQLDSRVDADGLLRIERAVLVSDSLQAEAAVSFTEGMGDIRHARIHQLSYGDNRLSGTVQRRAEGGYEIDVVGSRFDVAHFIDDRAAEPEIGEAVEEPGPPVRVTGRFAVVTAGPERRLSDVAVSLFHDGDTLDELTVDATVGSADDLRIRYAPVQGLHRLSVQASDAGEALKALDWTRRVEGGALMLEGEETEPGGPLIGTVRVERFVLRQAPVLAKLLEFMSLTGILSAFTQDGLSFVELTSDFRFENRILAFEQGRAYGASIGITAAGNVNVDTDIVDVEGTLVPAYTVNRIIGAIPLIGFLVTGGADEGLFAANYKIEGPLDDPRVAVNPLSALAPSFLRRLFRAEIDDGSEDRMPMTRSEEEDGLPRPSN